VNCWCGTIRAVLMLTGNAIKTRGSAALQLLVFFGGLALLWFGGSRAASSGPRLASQTAENVPVASLPFEYFRKHIFVTVQINDSGPHACMVDNGSNAVVIADRVARDMGIKTYPNGGKRPNMKGLGEGSGPKIFIAENGIVFRVQGAPILTGTVLVLDMSALEKELGRSLDCIIGSRLFLNFVVEVDFAKRQLMLYDPGSFVYSGQGRTVPLKIGAPATVQAEVLTPDGRTVKATVGLDLGSGSIIDFQPSFQLKHHVLQAQQPEVLDGAIGLAGEYHERTVRLPSVGFAGFKIEKPLAEFVDTPSDPGLASKKDDGFVGNALMERFTVIFDYSHHRLILEPNDSFGNPFTANMTGIGVDAASDPAHGFDVMHVSDGSVAATAGVRPGDRIVGINGVLCSTLTFESFHQMLTAEGTAFTLKVERGEQKIDISFQTPRLP
jgi:PDZ domain/Aspartyl protease